MDSRKRHEFRGVSNSGLIAVRSPVKRGALERGCLQKSVLERSVLERSVLESKGSEERRSGLCVEDLAWIEDSVGVKLGFDTPHQLYFGFCTTKP
jgi:hypothetical protein